MILMELRVLIQRQVVLLLQVIQLHLQQQLAPRVQTIALQLLRLHELQLPEQQQLLLLNTAVPSNELVLLILMDYIRTLPVTICVVIDIHANDQVVLWIKTEPIPMLHVIICVAMVVLLVEVPLHDELVNREQVKCVIQDY